MAKKERLLNRRARKQYSRLISEKLVELGCQNAITSRKLGSKRYVDPTKKGEDGNPLLVFEGDVIQLSNPHKNFMRKLRRLPLKAILQFLQTKPKEESQ